MNAERKAVKVNRVFRLARLGCRLNANGRDVPVLALIDELEDAVSELVNAARDCNEWLCRTDREHTAHQRQLAEALDRMDYSP